MFHLACLSTRGKNGDITAKVVVDQIMIQFFCSHVIHLSILNQYPSHTLTELDLYDANQAQYVVLDTIFRNQQQHP